MTEKARGVLILSLVLTALQTSWAEENTGSPEPTAQATVEAYSPDNNEHVEHGVDKRATYILPDDKRAQMVFHGMRGKKDFEPCEDCSLQDWSKRASMGFHGMRGKKLDEDVEDIDKRANLGFYGMRGKKWADYADEIKRAMGFHGMRGKKDFMLDEKRAMGFHGMRGKKLSDDEPFAYIPALNEDPLFLYNDEEKRAMAGFHGMRGKKDNEFPEFGLNRRASMGFHGMRGKKDDEEAFLDGDLEKRAMGFYGMRGKKVMDFNFKRAMGFLGMRGKKDFEDWNKRSPQLGFFGMRGKKNNDDGDDIENLLLYLTETSPTVERKRRAVYRNSKKAKSAFVGMRGKKSTVETGLEQLTK